MKQSRESPQPWRAPAGQQGAGLREMGPGLGHQGAEAWGDLGWEQRKLPQTQRPKCETGLQG